MKYLSLFIITFGFSGCSLLGSDLFNNEVFVKKQPLTNNTVIELYYSGGGATAPDITWVKKITPNGKKIIIGKIKDFTNSDSSVIKEIDKNHVAIIFTVEFFKDKPRTFIIDLNNRIERNDGSPYNE